MSHPLPPDVITALAAGHKIEAIKLLRSATGLDLKAAKDRIDAYDASNVAAPPPTGGGGMLAAGKLPPEAIEALRKGRIVDAIKLMRQAGMGLAEAKALIEHVQRGLPQGNEAHAPAAPSSHTPAAQTPHTPATAASHAPAAVATYMPGHDAPQTAADIAAYAPGGSRAALSPGEVPRGLGSGKWLVLAAVAVVAIVGVLVSGWA